MACPGAQVALVALGTRGDVQPLLALAAALAAGAPSGDVTLITHAAHSSWLAAAAAEAGVRTRWLDAPPARRWDALDSCSGEAQAPPQTLEEQREAVLQACQAALGCQLMGGGAVAATSAGPRLLIFNLFALEGWSIAQALRVRCLAASPCLVPYAPPAGFERRFAAAHPALHRRLKEAPPGSGARLGAGLAGRWRAGGPQCARVGKAWPPLTPLRPLRSPQSVGRRWRTGCGRCSAKAGAPGATTGCACRPCRSMTLRPCRRPRRCSTARAVGGGVL